MTCLDGVDLQCGCQHIVVRHQVRVGCLSLVCTHTCILERLRERKEGAVGLVPVREGSTRREVEVRLVDRRTAQGSNRRAEQHHMGVLVLCDLVEDYAIRRWHDHHTGIVELGLQIFQSQSKVQNFDKSRRRTLCICRACRRQERCGEGDRCQRHTGTERSNLRHRIAAGDHTIDGLALQILDQFHLVHWRAPLTMWEGW